MPSNERSWSKVRMKMYVAGFWLLVLWFVGLLLCIFPGQQQRSGLPALPGPAEGVLGPAGGPGTAGPHPVPPRECPLQPDHDVRAGVITQHAEEAGAAGGRGLQGGRQLQHAVPQTGLRGKGTTGRGQTRYSTPLLRDRDQNPVCREGSKTYTCEMEQWMFPPLLSFPEVSSNGVFENCFYSTGWIWDFSSDKRAGCTVLLLSEEQPRNDSLIRAKQLT